MRLVIGEKNVLNVNSILAMTHNMWDKEFQIKYDNLVSALCADYWAGSFT